MSYMLIIAVDMRDNHGKDHRLHIMYLNHGQIQSCIPRIFIKMVID